jgi:hypothetical protein
MKLIRSIAMPTDHNYHGFPVEVTRVDLYMDECAISAFPGSVELAKELQDERLRSHTKRMPHAYWLDKEPK